MISAFKLQLQMTCLRDLSYNITALLLSTPPTQKITWGWKQTTALKFSMAQKSGHKCFDNL